MARLFAVPNLNVDEATEGALCPGCGVRGDLQYRRWVKCQHILFCGVGCFREWQRRRTSPTQRPAEEPSRPAATDAVALFDSVAATDYDVNRPAWDRVLTLLSLKPCYQPAIREVLRQGRWRSARNPQGYVKTASYRLAMRMELPFFADRTVEPGGTAHRFRVVSSDAPCSKDPGYGDDGAGNGITEEEHLSWLSGGPINTRSYDPFLSAGIEKLKARHEAWERRHSAIKCNEPESAPRVSQAVLIGNTCRADLETDEGVDWTEMVPHWLRTDGSEADIPEAEYAGWDSDGYNSTHFVNWEKAAEVAVPKRYMRRFVARALHLRFDEFASRDEAVRRERKPADKQAIAAAYQWIQRNWEGRIRIVVNSHTEAAARAALSGVPKKPSTRTEKYMTASAALDRLTSRRADSRIDEGPRELLYMVRYGW